MLLHVLLPCFLCNLSIPYVHLLDLLCLFCQVGRPCPFAVCNHDGGPHAPGHHEPDGGDDAELVLGHHDLLPLNFFRYIINFGIKFCPNKNSFFKWRRVVSWFSSVNNRSIQTLWSEAKTSKIIHHHSQGFCTRPCSTENFWWKTLWRQELFVNKATKTFCVSIS